MIFKLGLALVAGATVFGSFAGERVPLWPEGKMPFASTNQYAAMWDVAQRPDFDADANRMPYLEWFEAPTGTNRTDACMILISGGGYHRCCDMMHIANWRRELTKLGIQCVSLVYRTPRPQGLPFYRTAWADGQRAVRLVRLEAAKRGFATNKIGTISMSAGSHLAALLATSSQTPAYDRVDAVDDAPCNINWACTFAIAYAVTDGLGTKNARGGDAPDAKLDSIFKFDAMTPPMWMSHGEDDPYSPFASTLVYRELRKRKIPAELHLYPNRGHGVYGFERAVEFMRQMGFLGEVGCQINVMERIKSDAGRGEFTVTNVWPEGKMPYADAGTNGALPYLEWNAPKELKTKAIQIIYSGGSYIDNDPHGFEVAPARRFLNDHGMTVVTMRYRKERPIGLAKHTPAWADLQRVIRLVRAEAPKRGLDPNRIGIMGSSAGGHLTLMGATSSRKPAYLAIDAIDKVACNVQLAIAIYPAYALTDGLDEHNTTSGTADSARLAPEFSFDPYTCPTLFIHGDEDVWAAMNSVKCWEQLRRMGLSTELHTLATRGHCFQWWSTPGTGSYTYLDRIWEFMTERGFNR